MDPPSLDDALLSLPNDLNETYKRILANIPDEYRRRAVRLLQFLTVASRPLRLEEAVDVVAVFPERTPAFKEESRMRKPEWIVRYCSSLTKIITSKRHNVRTKADEMITELQLAHLSVKEHLVSDHIEESFKHEFTSSRASAVIVEVSLAYLFAAVQNPYPGEVSATLPFMQFAAALWTHHAVLAEEDESAQSWIIKLFTVRSAFEYWHSVHYEREGMLWSFLRRSEERPDPLHYASQYGLAKSVAQLIKNGANIDRRSRHNGSALEIASNGGYKKIVEMLLPEYAKMDIDSRKSHLNNALQNASREGHKKIVELLIRQGAEVNAEADWGFALCAASLAEDEEIMELLIDEGADIDAHSDDYGTALQIASDAGNGKIVKALLDKDAKPNVREGPYGTALYAAAVRGHKDIVDMLLEQNAEPNLPGSHSNALYAAATRGYENIVEMLIHWGADVNTPGGHFSEVLAEEEGEEDDDADSRPLRAAALRGHENIVKMLLNNGAEVNAQGGYYSTALQAASCGGHKSIVSILIEKGATINAYGGHHGTALHAASYEGFKEIVELLVSGGADVNAPGGRLTVMLVGDEDSGHDSYALHAASFDGNEEIAKILLDNDAKVNAQGGHFGGALQAASYAGHPKILSMLLDRGADVNGHGGYYGNALRAALCGDYCGISEKSYRGRKKVVELLIAHGARHQR